MPAFCFGVVSTWPRTLRTLADGDSSPRLALGISAHNLHGVPMASVAFNRLRDVLLRYLSAPVVDSMLTVAMRKAGVTPEDLAASHLETVLHELSYGMRLFCPEDRVPQMMMDLAALADTGD